MTGLGITGGDDGNLGILGALQAMNPNRHSTKSRAAYLADELITLTESKTFAWRKGSNELTLAHIEEFDVVLQERRWSNPIRRIEGTTYHLYIFDQKEELLHCASDCDERTYTDSSMTSRLPIMDLYDVVTTGKRREAPPAHVCGLAGYDPMRDPPCPACEAARERRESATTQASA